MIQSLADTHKGMQPLGRIPLQGNRTSMKTIGIILVIVGALLAATALSMKVSVPVDPLFIGDTYRPAQEVNNIGLMDERRNLLIGAGFMILIGVQLIIGSGRSTTSTGSSQPTPPNSSSVAESAYTGPHDLSIDAYKLHLTRKHRIEFNTVLNKYVVGDALKDSLDDALTFAHETEIANRQLDSALLIHTLDLGFSASRAGLSVGDIILAYGDSDVSSNETLQLALLRANGANSTITFMRGGEIQAIPVEAGRLGVYCDVTKLSANEQAKRDAFDGSAQVADPAPETQKV